MKAEELQVGDYVKIIDSGKVIQLTCIDGSYDTANYFDADAEGELTIELRKLESIKLTKEILEKNEFEGEENVGYVLEHFDYTIIVDFWNNKIKVLRDYKIIIDIEKFWDVTIHELQHIFRLLEIDKKIVL